MTIAPTFLLTGPDIAPWVNVAVPPDFHESVLDLVDGTGGVATGPHFVLPQAVHALESLAQAHPMLQFIVAYLPPWHALLAGTDLQVWSACYQRVLATRRQLGARILLINIGKLAASELAAWLAERGHEAPQGLPPACPPDLALPLAQMLDNTYGQAWDTYEQLELCAQLLGREAESRDAYLVQDASNLTAMARLLNQGMRWDALYQAQQQAALREDALRQEYQTETNRATALQTQLKETEAAVAAARAAQAATLQAIRTQEADWRTISEQAAVHFSALEVQIEQARAAAVETRAQLAAARLEQAHTRVEADQNRRHLDAANARVTALQDELAALKSDEAMILPAWLSAQEALCSSAADTELAAVLVQQLQTERAENALLLESLHACQDRLLAEKADQASVITQTQASVERAQRAMLKALAERQR